MAEAKSTIEVANFSNILKEIDSNSHEVSVATDNLRLQIKVLCGRFSRVVENAKDAEQLKMELERIGWQNVSYKKGVVDAEGVLVTHLKKSGLEYRQSKPIFTEWDENAGLELYHYFLCFGKLQGEWQFYCEGLDETTPDPYEQKQWFTLDQINRDLLPVIGATLPTFLNDFSKALTLKRKEIEGQSKSVREVFDKIVGKPSVK